MAQFPVCRGHSEITSLREDLCFDKCLPGHFTEINFSLGETPQSPFSLSFLEKNLLPLYQFIFHYSDNVLEAGYFIRKRGLFSSQFWRLEAKTA
jgi:hypothetical protein